MNLAFLRRRPTRAVLLALVFASAGGAARAAKPPYPVAKKGAIVQDYGAVKVADPYRWLENADDPETVRWVDAENALTRVVPRRAAARGDQGAAHRASRLPARLRPREAGHALLLHPELRPPEPVRPLRARRPRRQGARAPRPQHAQRRRHRRPGRRRRAHPGRRAARLQPLPQRQRPAGDLRPRRGHGQGPPGQGPWAKFTAIIWTPDKEGFYYTRFPQPGSVPAGDENYFAKVYFHRLGDAQEKDALSSSGPTGRNHLGGQPHPRRTLPRPHRLRGLERQERGLGRGPQGRRQARSSSSRASPTPTRTSATPTAGSSS